MILLVLDHAVHPGLVLLQIGIPLLHPLQLLLQMQDLHLLLRVFHLKYFNLAVALLELLLLVLRCLLSLRCLLPEIADIALGATSGGGLSLLMVLSGRSPFVEYFVEEAVDWTFISFFCLILLLQMMIGVFECGEGIALPVSWSELAISATCVLFWLLLVDLGFGLTSPTHL